VAVSSVGSQRFQGIADTPGKKGPPPYHWVRVGGSVGAACEPVGAASKLLNDGTPRRWVCLEPDRLLTDKIKDNLPPGRQNCEILVGALTDLPQSESFDAILYMDVLEHIEDDKSELVRACSHLKQNGSLLVVAPALPWLFTPFDAAIGHHRRYTRTTLRAIVPAGLKEERIDYLDSIGMLTSVGNRLFLHTAAPKVGQILFWDRVLIPLSTVVDPVVAHSFGRSILAILRKVS
jgi:Methyltransferase domain